MRRPIVPIDNREKIEGKIVDWLAKGSSGQLIVFKPNIKDSIVDLVVKKRGDYGDELDLFLQIKECQKDANSGSFIARVSENDFKLTPNFYFIFVYFDIITQDIFDYVWFIPTTTFPEVARAVTAENGDKVFEFTAPIDVNEQSEMFRFLLPKGELARVLEKIIKEGGKFVVPGTGLSGITKVDPTELKEFLTEARRNTYAGSSTPSDNPRLKGSKELEYQRIDWTYQDIYFEGEKFFIGQELIYYNNKPVWAMNYLGDQIDSRTTEFLKYALFNLSEKCRLGQTCELGRKEYMYKDSGQGVLERFSGEESISYSGKEMYKLNYRGGLIVK